MSFDGVVFRNVDFTGAVGLEKIDRTKVEIEAPCTGWRASEVSSTCATLPEPPP